MTPDYRYVLYVTVGGDGRASDVLHTGAELAREMSPSSSRAHGSRLLLPCSPSRRGGASVLLLCANARRRPTSAWRRHEPTRHPTSMAKVSPANAKPTESVTLLKEETGMMAYNGAVTTITFFTGPAPVGRGQPLAIWASGAG